MRKSVLATVLSFGFILSLSSPANPVNSFQKIQDTAVNRLYQAYQYQATSDLIAAKLAKGGDQANSDLQLYYYNTLSMVHMRLNNLDSAKNCAYRSIKIASKSMDSALVSDAWKVMSYAYNKSGQLDSALYFTDKLLNYSKRVGDKRQYRNALSSMGTILNQNQRPGNALKYYQEANQVTAEIGDTSSFALSNYNLGLTFQKLKQYDSCFYYLQKAVLVAEKRKQSDLLFYVYGSMAESYLATGQKKEWEKYLLKTNSIAISIGNTQFQAMCFSTLATNAFTEENFTGAIKYGLKADSLLKINPYHVLQMNVDSLMYAACSKLSRFSEALAWHENFVKMKEKVIGENQEALLNKLMVEYGTREKNLMISKQNSEIRNKNIELQLLSLLLLITVISVALLTNYIIRIRRNRESLYLKEKYLDEQIEEIAQYKNSLTKSGTTDEAPDQAEDKSPLEKSAENPTPRFSLYLQLRELLEATKLYLDPELNQQTLIAMLGTNKKYLYQAIAGYGEENFCSLINRYRVDESKRLIEHNLSTGSSPNIEAIYLASGFHSAPSFYRIFKQHTGLTPMEYSSEALKQMKKAVNVAR